MKFGMEAIKLADFPHEFAAVAMQKSFELNISLALRAGQPPNTDKGFAISPKPMSMKTKTSSNSQGIPVVAGFIPWDQDTFGRPNSEPIHPEKGYEPKQLPVTLKEILNDAKKGLYEIKQVGDALEFKPLKADEDKRKNLTFSINLTEGENIAKGLEKSVTEMRPWHEKEMPDTPKFWDENKWGAFEEQVDKLHKVSYKKPDGNFEPLLVTANAADGKIVTGDADKLWDAIPVSFAKEVEGKYTQQYNAGTVQGLTELTEEYFDLRAKLTGNEEIDIDEIDNIVDNNFETFAQTAGIITPFELLLAKTVNDEFAKSAPYFNSLFQHGPETNNPGKPSPLDGAMLHFHKGLAVLTETEDELVEFVKQPGYLEEHYIPIHKGWDMKKWGDVIERQIELGQPVKEETLAAYNKYKAEHNLVAKITVEKNEKSTKMEVNFFTKPTTNLVDTFSNLFSNFFKSQENKAAVTEKQPAKKEDATHKVSNTSTKNILKSMYGNNIKELNLKDIRYIPEENKPKEKIEENKEIKIKEKHSSVEKKSSNENSTPRFKH